ncbi:MAGUK p55 subfamily member 5-like isoform X2 [Pollicipes pollicipes]|uniref:MAGUK p55 subfamily member 5-like isoform X2 n=1 Tax=Pollicipes pollicipes TaxID=41117 RepID=UPI00188511C9|nr:MAGUK p55 subfamily member 5-like isoform X2 [Pollicipes pollicipes]
MRSLSSSSATPSSEGAAPRDGDTPPMRPLSRSSATPSSEGAAPRDRDTPPMRPLSRSSATASSEGATSRGGSTPPQHAEADSPAALVRSSRPASEGDSASLRTLSESSGSSAGASLPTERDDEQKYDTHQVEISMAEDGKRFGFSVIGGADEGIRPKIDDIAKGSPADKADLEVGDEILEVNGRSLENATHTEVISHIHQCIRSRTICLRVKRKAGNKLALDLAQSSNVQDAFVIAVEQQARERLEKLSALRKIKPVDMTKLSQQLSSTEKAQESNQLNGIIESNTVYVTSVPSLSGGSQRENAPERQASSGGQDSLDASGELELNQELRPRAATVVEVTPEGGEAGRRRRSQRRAVEAADAMAGRCGVNGAAPAEAEDPQRASGKFKNKVFISHNDSKRSSKESLSSHKSSRTASSGGGRSRAGSVEQLQLEAVMNQLDRGPHREMAVDVPESFVARTKTPPRYPPPRAAAAAAVPGARPANGAARSEPPAREAPGTPTEPPAPAPRPSLDRSRGSSTTSRDSEPSREQMERIRKYQEDIRRDREMREKRSKEEEFLRSSLRGSEKMKRLEQRPAPTGFVNNGYDAHGPEHATAAAGGIELSELLASLKQIQRALRSDGRGLQHELAAAQALLTSPEFQRVLAVHNKVQEIWCFSAPPSALCHNAQDVVQEVVGVLQDSSTPEAAELVDLLTRFDMEGLLYSHDQIAVRGSAAASPEPSPLLDDYAERVHHYTDPRVRVIRLEKTNEPLGATVKNEGDSVLVGRIVKGGAADKSGLLRPGDEILEVNGIEMRGKSVDDVCDILAGMTGSLVFLALPREEEEEPEKTKPAQAVLHVKAHFDYDPEDDIYMPCREIGMSFQKGDILHVTSQEDPDWWQATRDGDEDLPLSGLIPSLSFQTQRETLKQSIIDSSRKEGKKTKFLCAKRTNKKKKKMYNAEYNDDYEANEILTYEEVGLYYPRANHKRPVVLIGPPNIGRHELRQKLMEDTDRFSAAVPHTSRPRKDTELDGQDYHFISRPQFEQDIVNRLFVEHGEYERAYYGTSINAIRTVVNSSKICVLNLHPHSLKILKNTDLKPFVVFVAPPSLEKLRQMKQKAGEQVRDDELKHIIEKAREIEEVYGHYFDIVIINSDLGRAYEQLIHEINTLEREPQWVPATWLRQDAT